MTFSFRPLRRDDFPLMLKWHHREHASQWFGHEPTDLEGTEEIYGPVVDGIEPTFMHAILCDDVPVGYMQYYLVDSYPEYAEALGVHKAAGVDFIIGEPSLVDRGHGPELIRRYVDEIVIPGCPDIVTVVSTPSPENGRSVRALEKAGFQSERDVIVEGQSERLMVCRVSQAL